MNPAHSLISSRLFYVAEPEKASLSWPQTAVFPSVWTLSLACFDGTAVAHLVVVDELFLHHFHGVDALRFLQLHQ